MYWFIEKLSHFWGSVAFAWEEDTPRWFRLAHRCVTHAFWVIGVAWFFAWLDVPLLPEALIFVFLSLIAAVFAIGFWPIISAPLKAIGFFSPQLNAKLVAIDTWLERNRPLRKSEDGLIDEWTYVRNSRLTKAQARRALERHAQKRGRNE